MNLESLILFIIQRLIPALMLAGLMYAGSLGLFHLIEYGSLQWKKKLAWCLAINSAAPGVFLPVPYLVVLMLGAALFMALTVKRLLTARNADDSVKTFKTRTILTLVGIAGLLGAIFSHVLLLLVDKIWMTSY